METVHQDLVFAVHIESQHVVIALQKIAPTFKTLHIHQFIQPRALVPLQ